VLSGFEGPTIRARLVQTSDLSLKGRRVVAFAGIGRPEKFFAGLRSQGAIVAEERAYGDHHVYTQSQMARLKARARAESAMLVTTEKDYVRLTPTEREGIVPLPVQTVFDDGAALDRLLDRLTKPALPPQA
jgi:tetraacyldisaccharide 4'-kinase